MVGNPLAGDYPISQVFARNPQLYRTYDPRLKGHDGIDWACPSGTPVIAVDAGVIGSVRDSGSKGYGKHLTHSKHGVGWLYGHLSRIDVVPGQQVQKGQQLGLSGNTGTSTGPHLHLGYWIDGTPIDNGFLGYSNPYALLTERAALKRVILQRAHYPNAGGAPGEAAWTAKIVAWIAQELPKVGITPIVVDDFYNRAAPGAVGIESALAVFFHYDASVYGPTAETNRGCFADRGLYETLPQDADRFIALWEQEYTRATGIPLANQRRNANTREYYGYSALSEATPGVLIEHGCGATTAQFYNGRLYPEGGDRSILHDRWQIVATSDLRAVLRYLSAWNPTPPAPEVVAMLTDDELLTQIVEPLWLPISPYSADGTATGIARSWMRELRAGRFRGIPMSGEIGLLSGNGVWQRFAEGIAIWKGGADPDNLDVSWKG